MEEYVEKYGTPGHHFACYHQHNNKSNIVRIKEPEYNNVQKMLWNSFCLVLGIVLIAHAVYRNQLVGERWYKTFFIVLGFGSYMDLGARCIVHCKSQRASPAQLEQETNADSQV